MMAVVVGGRWIDAWEKRMWDANDLKGGKGKFGKGAPLSSLGDEVLSSLPLVVFALTLKTLPENHDFSRWCEQSHRHWGRW